MQSFTKNFWARWLLVLLLNLIAGNSLAEKAPECQYKKPTYFDQVEKSFCLEFAPDYFHRLTSFAEEHTYNGSGNGASSQKMQRPKISVKGALFLLGQVRSESGWGVTKGMAASANNYWGLGGDYPLPNGQSSFMRFKSFEQGFAFLLNHFERGINTAGKKSSKHPGWPKFLPELSKPELDLEAINRSLNSGVYCKKFPAYNTDPKKDCPEGDGKCGCLNYAGLIFILSTKLVVDRCLAVMEKVLEGTPPKESKLVFHPDHYQGPKPLAPWSERLQNFRNELKSYAVATYPKTYCANGGKMAAASKAEGQEWNFSDDAAENRALDIFQQTKRREKVFCHGQPLSDQELNAADAVNCGQE